MKTMIRSLFLVLFASLMLSGGQMHANGDENNDKKDTSYVKWGLTSIAGALAVIANEFNPGEVAYEKAVALDYEWKSLLSIFCRFLIADRRTFIGCEKVYIWNQLDKCNSEIKSFLSEHALNFELDSFEALKNVEFDYTQTLQNKPLMAKLYAPISIAGGLIMVYATYKAIRAGWNAYQANKKAKNKTIEA